MKLAHLETSSNDLAQTKVGRRANLQDAKIRQASSPSPQTMSHKAGDDEVLVHPLVPAQELTPNFRAALAQLQSQISSLRADRTRLVHALLTAENLADTDTLVPVFNRRAFVRELTRVMSFAQRYDVQASLVYFDLDGFKQINDRFGHAAGDAVLKSVGQTLLSNIRESDLAGRVGGDEFAVILAKAGPTDAQMKGAQLAQAIRDQTIHHLGYKLQIGAAFGAYTFEAGDTAERALSRADEAMYSHKIGRKVQSL